MNCFHCHKTINEKPWLHLTNIVSLNEDKEQMLVDKYICGYSCYKRLYESGSLPKKLSQHIVNKEDYKGLIRPVSRIKKKEFTYLSYDEIQSLPEEERELYHEQMDKQIHINPIFSVIHDEIIDEEERVYTIENDNSSEYSYHGDDDY
tara:strand:- start:51 stop:494 length:444 start_codon:yes stop_codon:yes gene_type:complete